LSDHYMKYQLEGTSYCALYPVIGISCTDHTNGYVTLLPLIGISWADYSEGTMYDNHLCDQYMKYQLEVPMYNNHGYCTLFPLIGILCADHTNGYFTLFPLIGI
jgi:hypothetical protein